MGFKVVVMGKGHKVTDLTSHPDLVTWADRALGSPVPGLSRRGECARRNAQALCFIPSSLSLSPMEKSQHLETVLLREHLLRKWGRLSGRRVEVGTQHQDAGGETSDFMKLFQPGRIHRSLGALGFLWLFVGLPGFGDCGPIKRGAGSTGPRGSFACTSSDQTHES